MSALLVTVCASPAGVARAAASGAGNPYSFYGSVAECAAAQRNRCDACLSGGPCPAITDADGKVECMQLTAKGGRGEFLICINLALAVDAVDACAASRAPSCPRDPGASVSLSSLEANAEFLDDPACGAPLDGCLAALYGSSSGGFPGPGSGGSASPRPRSTSVDCGDSFSGDPNCDADCELDGPDCEAPYDGTCADSNEQSGCSDSGGADGGGDCSSSDSGGGDCSSSDGGGGDCSGGDGGGCSGGDGGDCSGGGGDCSGGGGDCGGGGGDCNVGGRRGRPGAGLPVALAWALLPIPFAVIVRRRAERRRGRAEYDATPPDADGTGAEPGGVPGGAP